MWRYPVLLPGDVKLAVAVPVPLSQHMTRNGVFVSLRDFGITDLGTPETSCVGPREGKGKKTPKTQASGVAEGC